MHVHNPESLKYQPRKPLHRSLEWAERGLNHSRNNPTKAEEKEKKNQTKQKTLFLVSPQVKSSQNLLIREEGKRGLALPTPPQPLLSTYSGRAPFLSSRTLTRSRPLLTLGEGGGGWGSMLSLPTGSALLSQFSSGSLDIFLTELLLVQAALGRSPSPQSGSPCLSQQTASWK